MQGYLKSGPWNSSPRIDCGLLRMQIHRPSCHVLTGTLWMWGTETFFFKTSGWLLWTLSLRTTGLEPPKGKYKHVVSNQDHCSTHYTRFLSCFRLSTMVRRLCHVFLDFLKGSELLGWWWWRGGEGNGDQETGHSQERATCLDL